MCGGRHLIAGGHLDEGKLAPGRRLPPALELRSERKTCVGQAPGFFVVTESPRQSSCTQLRCGDEYRIGLGEVEERRQPATALFHMPVVFPERAECLAEL